MDIYGLLFSKSLGGGGGSGADNYNELSNKPQINSVTLSGNKSLEALGIQSQLTFDTEPTEDSTNPVESGGVYSALASKQDTLTIDDTPTENSSNPVQSGGTYTALAGKQDTLTFDDSPTNGSSNPVKSGGVYSALSDKQDTLAFEGTYNASTNKAATESTVSDAIKALDVAGDSGIAASKTISAWSETDGKAIISTQDIAIAGTQAVLTGYTPESPSQTDSILATDTVNAAIKKLDERSRVDENNILSVADQSTKYNIAQGRARTLDSVTSTVSGYTITFSGTSSGTRSFSFLEPFSPPKSGDYVWKYTNGVTIGGTPISVYMWDTTANVGVNATDIEVGLKVTLDSTHLYTLAFTLQNNKVVSGDYSVMIISKDLWDKGFTDYQPYAMSNAELTADVASLTAKSQKTISSSGNTSKLRLTLNTSAMSNANRGSLLLSIPFQTSSYDNALLMIAIGNDRFLGVQRLDNSNNSMVTSWALSANNTILDITLRAQPWSAPVAFPMAQVVPPITYSWES